MGVSLCGFKSRPRHHIRRSRGDVAKWSKAEVCKTSIRRFESARRLQMLKNGRKKDQVLDVKPPALHLISGAWPGRPRWRNGRRGGLKIRYP